jgi:YidC/Oxa1 family membrane protein insertase
MERRVLLAIVLSFVILYAYQAFFVPPPPTRQAAPAAATGPAATGSATAEAPPAETAADLPSTTPAPQAVLADAAEREIVVETNTVQAVFTNRGARLLHWRLKDYRDDQGAPVDLVPSDLPTGTPAPFSLRFDDARLTGRLNGALFRASGVSGTALDARTAPATLTFEFEDAAGLRARKSFLFSPSGYVVKFSTTVTNGTESLTPTIEWGPGLSDRGALSGGGSFFTGNYVQKPQAIVALGTEVERVAASALQSNSTREGQFTFAGIDDHFFMAAVVRPPQARYTYRPMQVGADDASRELVSYAVRFAEPPQDVSFFLGPKQFDILQAVDSELVRAIHYGMFAVIIVPMLSSLKWLYALTGNYGWSIVLLTLIINLLIAPFRHKQVVSMRKMQAIQPRMKAIQDRYAHLKLTDPARQKMNTEISTLYKEAGVNPVSGCLPMVMTMPVLIAFYSLLSMSIELRGAPFVAWVLDLSIADPYYVLPVLMSASMFWQQKISPTTADPTQQRIMMMMPIMFTGIMAFSPAGVVLYWFISNVWNIGQQYVTNWLIGPPEKLAQPPAARKVKSVGAGRSADAEKKA